MCFFETFALNSILGILMNFSAKNPPHRQTVAVGGKFTVTLTKKK